MRDLSHLPPVYHSGLKGRCPFCGAFAHSRLPEHMSDFYSWRQLYYYPSNGTPYWVFCDNPLCEVLLLFQVEREP